MKKQNKDIKTTKIYLITNITDNPYEVYIGKTKDIKGRIRNHKIKYHKNIQVNVIDECKMENWKEIEQYWISQFQSWGFKLDNKNKGGGGATSFTQTQKNNISKAKKGIKFTAEHIKKLSKAKKGICYNKTGRARNKVHKKVLQYTLDGEFIKKWDGGANEANLAINGVRLGSIGDCCRGKCKTAYGYKWKYE